MAKYKNKKKEYTEHKNKYYNKKKERRQNNFAGTEFNKLKQTRNIKKKLKEL